jgi:hypothetical protein
MFRALASMPSCSPALTANAACSANISSANIPPELSCTESFAGDTCKIQPNTPRSGHSILTSSASPELPSIHNDFRERVDSILAKNPMMTEANGQGKLRVEPLMEQLTQFPHGHISFPRLEKLHHLLCGEKTPSQVLAVENGAANILTNALALAATGSRVVIKELDPLYQKMFHYQINRIPDALRSLITFCNGMDAVHSPLEADIAYWVSPPPMMIPRTFDESLKTSLTSDSKLLDYMGRDVIQGGFLVIQTDQERFARLPFHPFRWERVFFRLLSPIEGSDGTVLNTTNFNMLASLLIFRKK